MLSGMVAIVGRPNVGKSTLFNRLTRSNRAIIDDQPGVTRDRLYAVVESVKDDTPDYIAVDTGGFETKDYYFQPFQENIVWKQTVHAIEEADVIVMVLDAKTGLHPHDKEILQFLKTTNKPLVCVVNKVDGKEQQALTFEFYELGLGDLLHMSAAHNRGVWELSEAIENQLESLGLSSKTSENSDAHKVAIIGRPNAGKSSILNRICGETRSLVSEVAGTTRDPINVQIKYQNESYEILDTAGIRRRTKIHDKLEGISVIRSLKAIENADVVILVIDAKEGLSDQDARLASLAVSQFKPLLFVINKWDLIENKHSNSARDYEDELKYKLKDISYVPVVFVSCLQNQRVFKIMEHVHEILSLGNKRVPTAKLNEILQQAVKEHTPALMRSTNKRVKFFYATQVRSAPPTIVIKCNVAEEIQESYKRYLTKRFRDHLGFQKVPLRLLFRGKDHDKKRAELAEQQA